VTPTEKFGASLRKIFPSDLLKPPNKKEGEAGNDITGLITGGRPIAARVSLTEFNKKMSVAEDRRLVSNAALVPPRASPSS
jgi:hypothetical protein